MSGARNSKLTVNFILPIYWPAVGGCEIYTHQLVQEISKHAKVRIIAQINCQKDKTSWEALQKKGTEWWWPKDKEPYEFGAWYNMTFLSEKPELQLVKRDPEVWLINLSDLEKKLIWRFFRERKEREDTMIGVLSKMFERKIRHLANRGEIFHCVNGGFSYFYHAALRASRKMGVPVVFSPILHVYHFGWEEELKRAKENNASFIYTPQVHFFNPAENRLSERYLDRYWKEMCRDADFIATLTEYEKNVLVDLGFDKEKIEPVGSGPVLADKADIDIRKKWSIADGPIVLFAGRNHESKGIREILEAAKIVWQKKPDVNFLFVGPHESNASYLYSQVDSPRLITPGKISLEEKTAAFKTCDLLCLPSLHESLGIVFLEAWMFEKPILAADIPQVRELTENGRGGLLVNPVPEEIAKKILLILQDTELAAEFGKWGKERVLTKYNWEMTSQKLLAIYEGLLHS